jgi:HD-GYP domain-containing protein (c-di-GMP phosphodiesterase class II)
MEDRREHGAATGTRDPVNLQDEGRKILAGFYSTLRSMKFYPLENETVQQALLELHETLTRFLAREGLLELRVMGEFFFLNEVRLRLDLRNFSTFGSFARSLRSHGIGELVVERGVQLDEWAPFLALVLRDPPEEEIYQTFQRRLAQTPVRHISARPEKEIQPLDLEDEAMEGAKRTYAYSVQMAREVLSDARIGRAVNVRKVKRAVQSIVDQVLSNEPSIMAMTTLREFDEYTFAHSVNVCIFSVVIGQRLGLTKQELYELGLGALFHDVGKTRVGGDVLNKEDQLTDEDWEALKQHPTAGLLVLFRLHGFQDVPSRQMLMAYEHHMKMDLTGYPPCKREREIGLFSRIVAVADAFDAGSSVRSYQHRPWPPDELLKEMGENPERGFDTVLVKALMTATGVYPVGTVVVLDTFELGVVTRPNEDVARLHQPEVKIISDPMGVPMAQPLTVRLDEVDPATGEPKRTIIKTTDADRYGIRVAEYVT